MTKGRISLPLQFLIYLLLFAVVAFALSEVGRRFGAPVETTQDSPALKDFTVVLDAGHGGEDGGAVSASGIYEKNLNLSIAMLVRDLLEANGVKVVMTRETDILLYDRNVDYVGRKKALDLAARRQIAEQTPNAIFVSIHMNAYPQTQYRGLQVWYSPNNHGSEEIAKCVQERVRGTVQPENDRQIKLATSSIYLLHHLEIPAVLIECGFLSNPEEAALLATSDYQRQLALSIFLSIMDSQSATVPLP